MHKETEHELEHLIDKDKFTGRAETEARLNQEHIERAAVLDRAFFDDSVDFIDYKILNLAAKAEEHTITSMDVYEGIHEYNENIHPVVEETIAHEKFLPRMMKLAKAKYLIETEEENTPGIFKGFKLNLDFK